MSTHNAFYVRKKAADDVTRAAILKLYPEADFEAFRKFVGVEIELALEGAKRSGQKLSGLSANLRTDVIWVGYQTTAGGFCYFHWRNGSLPCS